MYNQATVHQYRAEFALFKAAREGQPASAVADEAEAHLKVSAQVAVCMCAGHDVLVWPQCESSCPPALRQARRRRTSRSAPSLHGVHVCWAWCVGVAPAGEQPSAGQAVSANGQFERGGLGWLFVAPRPREQTARTRLCWCRHVPRIVLLPC